MRGSETAIDRTMPSGVERHLVLVRTPGWQSLDDFKAVAAGVRQAEPRIGVFVLDTSVESPELLQTAAKLPTLVFSPGPLRKVKPLRGKVYQGRPMHKFEQLRRLAAAGVRVPRTALLTPGLTLEPALWGEHVVVKPTDLGTSSHGLGIQLMRRERVRYIAPKDYPEGHPGRLGPMLVQQFIDTGEYPNYYRCLTLFGRALYCMPVVADTPRAPLSADDETLESEVIAIQAIGERTRRLVIKADVLAAAQRAYAALPEFALQGCDVVRDAKTGRLYVLEVNPGGNSWHFSSRHNAAMREKVGPDFVQQWYDQMDGLGTASQILAERTLAEAE